MKKKNGFTLIELLAVIVILAVIALISTPIIIGVIDKARKKSFENTAYGVYDAAELYFADKLADDNKFEGRNFNFNESTDELKISGEKPKEGYVSIDSDGVVSLAISNDRWCIRILAGNKKAYTTDGKCVEKTLKELIESDSTHIVRNTKVNGEVVNKVKGTYSEKLTMKNYVWYSGQLWQVLETNDSKHSIKLITAQALTSIAYGETNDWSTSWVKKWLNDDKFYPVLDNKEYIIESGFCIDEPEVESTQITYAGNDILSVTNHTPIRSCTHKVKDKVGLMTFEDYAYAEKGDSTTYAGGNFLDEGKLTWTMTPSTREGKNTQMWMEMYTKGYLTIGVGSGKLSSTSNLGHGVRPVIHVRDTVLVESGTGTKKDPYVLFGEKKVGKNSPIKNAKVGDYVYLDESNNPNPFTSEFVADTLSYQTTKDKVRYRIVNKEEDGSIKVQRADILRNLPSTISFTGSENVLYYYSSTCGMIDGLVYRSGCRDHNMFLPNEGTSTYQYTDSENVGFFLNHASNSFYNWYSDQTKNMIQESEWELPTSGEGKDYSHLNDGSDPNYPGRTYDGKAKAKVGLPSWGEMYTGSDINYNYWLINRQQNSDTHVAAVSIRGSARGDYVCRDLFALRPIVRLKREVKIGGGDGTMTSPYILKIN